MNATPLPELSPIAKGIAPRLTECGKIKIGEKGAFKKSAQGNEFQPPRKLDHFRVTTLERGQDGNFLMDEQIHKMLGGPEPKEIPIVLLFDDIARNFRTMFVCYRGKTRWCMGDGENAWRVDDQGNTTAVSCPCERLKMDYKGNTRCYITGILSVVIRGAENVGGVWVLRTHSWNTCQGILSSLFLIQGRTQGKIAGIPYWLTISPKTATTPDAKSQIIYVVGIEYKGTTDELMETAYKISLQNAKYAKQLELVAAEVNRIIADNVPAIEDADFIEEFVPEQVQTGPTDRPISDPGREPEPKTTRRGRPPKVSTPAAPEPPAPPELPGTEEPPEPDDGSGDYDAPPDGRGFFDGDQDVF